LCCSALGPRGAPDVRVLRPGPPAARPPPRPPRRAARRPPPRPPRPARASARGANHPPPGGRPRFARRTNLSETTCVLPPTDPAADYRLRIFTPGGELPFAGHPTLGSAHAWLEAGGAPRVAGTGVQECGSGLVRLRAGYRLAFDAPPLIRSGPVEPEVREQVARALRLPDDALLACEWAVNGPSWIAVRLADAATVLALEPDPVAMGDLAVGVAGPSSRASESARTRSPGASTPPWRAGWCRSGSCPRTTSSRRARRSGARGGSTWTATGTTCGSAGTPSPASRARSWSSEVIV